MEEDRAVARLRFRWTAAGLQLPAIRATDSSQRGDSGNTLRGYQTNGEGKRTVEICQVMEDCNPLSSDK
jgi:hypothetical protein